MIDLSERPFKNSYEDPGDFRDTIVVDNGTYELRAGYLGKLSVSARNHIFKYKDRVSFEPFSQSTVKSMFDSDIIVNFDVLEATIDLVLRHLSPVSLKKLVITATPFMPTEADVVDFLFRTYRFDSIQVVPDYICAYAKYFGGQDALVISAGYSSIIVSYVSNYKPKETIKNTFGAKMLLDYIRQAMLIRYKDHKRDFSRLVEYLRVSPEYDKEALEICNEIRSGSHLRNLIITDAPQFFYEESEKKVKKAAPSVLQLPDVDYKLIGMDDKELDPRMLKEKRRHRMIFFGSLNRFKVRASEKLNEIRERVDSLKDSLEKRTNPQGYLQRKKERFGDLLRQLELREKLRQDLKNRKTREFQIKIKEGNLDQSERDLKVQIANAEDEELGRRLHKELDEVAAEISAVDPEFQPFSASIVDVLQGFSTGQQCLNIELIKWPEIFFEPSIIGSDQMGLSEIFELISSSFPVRNVLICGGLSSMPGLSERCRNELNSLSKSGPVNLVVAENFRADPFLGAFSLGPYPVYIRSEYEKHGSKELVSRNTKWQ